MRIIFAFIICIFLGSITGASQTALPDSTLVLDNTDINDTSAGRTGFFSIFTGKPGKAAFYGLLVPGGGQFYNKRYFTRLPLVLAAEGTILFLAIKRTQDFKTINAGFLGLLNGYITEWEQGITQASLIRSQRDAIRREKDLLWFAFGIVHVLAITEAFVDAHLLDFDIDDDLSFRIAPQSQMLGVNFVTVTIPLNKKQKPVKFLY